MNGQYQISPKNPGSKLKWRVPLALLPLKSLLIGFLDRQHQFDVILIMSVHEDLITI